MRTTLARLTTHGLLFFALLGAPAAGQDELPGSDDAVIAAVDRAVGTAVAEMLAGLGEGIDSVAVFPIDGDTAVNRVTDRVEYEVVNRGGMARVVTRRDEVFTRTLSEFEFTEKRFDLMPAEEQRRFGNMLGVDAIVYGAVRRVGIDDTSVRGRAEVSLSMVVVETGQVVGSGWQTAVVGIDADTVTLSIMSKPWFWVVVVCVAVGGFVVAVVWIVIGFPLRRRAKLALKPREVIR
jgi:hypothetical protein